MKEEEIASIVEKHGKARDACIEILQDIQETYGYLPAEAIDYVARHTKITKRQLYGVATFYERFRFKPVGKHLIRACHGTACHVNGAKHTSREVESILKIKNQETTPDGLFTLETVACLGCCSLAPVMMIDDTAYGRLSPKEMRRILSEHRRRSDSKEEKQP